VLPLEGYSKHPRYPFKDKDLDYFHRKMTSLAARSTGWALLPRPADPVPFFVLDVDSYDVSTGDIERVLYGDNVMPPKKHCVVTTPSGGRHYYYRLPKDVHYSALPSEFEWFEPETASRPGSSAYTIKGEVRVSSPKNIIIVLPGSVGFPKKETSEGDVKPQTTLGQYIQTEGSILDPPEVPDCLLVRLTTRTPRTAPLSEREESRKLPTEAEHLLAVWGLVPNQSIPHGTWNVTISQAGQQLGRMWARRTPSDPVVERFWQVLGQKFESTPEHAPDPASFGTAFRSGYQTGRKNAESYAPREKFPTATDLDSEIRSVCGGPLHITENLSQDGKRDSFTLMFGGSPKRPQDVKKAITVRSITDPVELLGNIVRITAADPDKVSRSPLNNQPGWIKQLKVNLMATRGVDRAGLPLLDQVREMLKDAGETAAENGSIGRNPLEGCPMVSGGGAKKQRKVQDSCWWELQSTQATLHIGARWLESAIHRHGADGRRVLGKLGVEKAKGYRGVGQQKGHRILLADVAHGDEEYERVIQDVFLQFSERERENLLS